MTAAGIDPEQIRSLITVFGEDFLRYVLASTDVTAIEAPSDGQVYVANLLSSQAAGILNDATSSLERFTQLSGFSNYVPDAKTSVVNWLRTLSGGELPTIEDHQDAVLANLLTLTRDTWPVYLLPTPSEGPKTFWVSMPIGIFQHPSMLEAARSIVADEALAKLFPESLNEPLPIEKFEDLGRYTGMTHSITVGRSGSLHLSGLIGSLISDAVFRSLIGQEKLKWDTLKESTERSLNDARMLARGKNVQVPAIAGLSGIRLDAGASIKVAGGKLRNPTKPELGLLLPKPDEVTVVFETTFTKKLHIYPDSSFISNDYNKFEKVMNRTRPQLDEAHKSYAGTLSMLRLALLLASTNENPYTFRELSRFFVDPILPGGNTFWGIEQTSPTTQEVSETDRSSIQEWSETIASKHHHTLDVGVRRLISATTSRVDPIDAFVDAVICWENMFGAKTETTFRVTASVVKLIGPEDSTARYELQKEMKDLYSKRSALVHGGQEPPPNKIQEYRTRAVQIAADCFRTLYRDRPELIDLESEKRSALLLLE